MLSAILGRIGCIFIPSFTIPYSLKCKESILLCKPPENNLTKSSDEGLWSPIHTLVSHAWAYIDSTLIGGISHMGNLNRMVLLTVTSKLEILTLCNWFHSWWFLLLLTQSRRVSSEEEETLSQFITGVHQMKLLVIRGVPSLIFAQKQVSAPLNSRPVIGYRKGRATPIQSPVWSSGWNASHMVLHVG